MVFDVTLKKPDATETITFRSVAVTMTGGTPGQILTPLPSRDTLGIDLGYRTTTFQIDGKFTWGQGGNALLDRDNLVKAWLNWWNVGDGQMKFKWGTENDGTDFDFKVFIKQLIIKWRSDKPGTPQKPVFDFSLTLQEVNLIGTESGLAVAT